MIEIGGWQVITFFVSLVITIIGMLTGFGKLLLSQFESKLNEKFKFTEEKYRQMQVDVATAKQGADLAREAIMELRTNLATEYQRREDAIRIETVNAARFDAINEKLDRVILMNGNLK